MNQEGRCVRMVINSVSITALIAVLLLIPARISADNLPLKTQKINNMKRYGNVIKVKPEKLEYYKKLHANPWPEVIKAIKECNIRNFSIYLKDDYLFSYYEYIGKDFEADMKKLSELTKVWLKETDPCQTPVESAKEGEWWSAMEEVFHAD